MRFSTVLPVTQLPCALIPSVTPGQRQTPGTPRGTSEVAGTKKSGGKRAEHSGPMEMELQHTWGERSAVHPPSFSSAFSKTQVFLHRVILYSPYLGIKTPWLHVG